MCPGHAQTEDHHSQDQALCKGILTYPLSCVWTALNAFIRHPLQQYPIPGQVYMVHLHLHSPRTEAKNMHLSLPIISDTSSLHQTRSEMIPVPR